MPRIGYFLLPPLSEPPSRERQAFLDGLRAKRIALLWNSRNPNAGAESVATLEAAKSLGISAEPYPAADDAQLRRALGRIGASRPDALYVAFEGGLVAGNRSYIAEFGVRQRIPLVSGWSLLTEAGGLVSYAPDIPAMFHRSASYVHRILKGAKPGELPIEQASTVELVLNLNTAKALGVTIPLAMRVRADRIIE